MATLIHKGFYTALQAGSLVNSADIRLKLLMTGTTADTVQLAVNLDDFTIDEFDGIGYSEIDAASVTIAYVDAAFEVQLNFTDPASFGNPVAPGSTVIQGMLVYLYVDGTDANDIALAYTSDGGFGGNASNGAVTLTLSADGLMFIRSA